MRTVSVPLGSRSYDIVIGWGAWQELPRLLGEMDLGGRFLLVTNPTIWDLYGPEWEVMMEGRDWLRLLIPDSESSKNLQTMEELYQKALEWGVDRRTTVLALGGGVVGDTAGFLAATLLRGLPWIQLPTTLLAQVDSSVGGKVGINHPLGKNMIGAFHQPALVLAELKTLKTLPARELRAGMAEVVKYGVIADADFFVWLEDKGERMVQLEDWELVEQAVAVSCAIKSRVVGQDEREAGLRAILNFGHTVGHGIEMAAGYGRFRHGEAVSIGMVVAAEIARLMGLAPSPVRSRLESLLSRLGLPYQPPSDLDFEVIQQAIQRDKKNQAGSITMVLPVELGQVQCVKPVRPEVIGQAWKDLLASG